MGTSTRIRRSHPAASVFFAIVLGAATSAGAQMGMGMGHVDSAELLSNVPGSNELQQASGFFLGTTCDGLADTGARIDGSGATNDLFRECSRIVSASIDLDSGRSNADGFDVDDVLNSLFAVAHEESTAQARLAFGIAGASMGRIHQRMVALREGASGIQVAGIRFLDEQGNHFVGEDVTAAFSQYAADPDAGSGLSERVGIFLNGIGAWGDYDGGDREIDYDTRTWGLVGGADYRISDELVAGAAVTFARTDDDFARDAGTLKSDVWSGAFFASYGRDAWFVDGIFTLAGIDYELRRDLRYPTLQRTADGDTDGFLIAAAAGAGYDFQFGALRVGPRAGIEYVDTEISSFEERNAGGLDLAYDSQNIQSLTTNLGVRADYAISTGFGIVSPYARASWEVEYMDSSRTITTRFVADPNRTRFRLRTQNPDRNVVDLGAGVALQLPHGFSAFVDFDTVLFSKLWDLYTVTVGGRIAF